MPKISIDPQRCCGDALCLQVCPAGCFRMRDSIAATIPFAEKICINCGQCMAICPKAAISVDAVPADSLAEARTEVSPEALAGLIKSRRSVRNFKDKPVPREVIEQALETARYAPTGKNNQDVQWLVLESRESVLKAAGAVIDVMRQDKALHRLVEAHDNGLDPIFRGAPCAIFAHVEEGAYNLSVVDCAIAVSYLDLICNTLGLGCCWAGFAMKVAENAPPVRALMGLPEGRQIYAGLMVGYPSLKYRHAPARKPARIIWS